MRPLPLLRPIHEAVSPFLMTAMTLRSLLLSLLLVSLPVSGSSLSFAQTDVRATQGDSTPRWTLRAGIGTMISTFEDDGGAVSVEIGRRFDTGFVGTIGVTRSRTSGTYSEFDLLFEGDSFDVSHTTVHLGFAYPLPLFGSHVLTVGTGAVYTRSRAVVGYADVFVDETTTQVFIGEIGMSTIQEANAGLLLSSEYLYRRSRFEVGVRVQGHLLYDVGLNQFVVGPVVGVRF